MKKKSFILMVIICLVMSFAIPPSSTNADAPLVLDDALKAANKEKQLKDLSQLDEITFVGHTWIVLEPAEGYIFMKDPLTRRAFDLANGGLFDPSSPSTVGYYLNNTYYKSFEPGEQAVIQTHRWNGSKVDNPNVFHYNEKIGIFSYWDWEKYSKKYNSEDGVLENPNDKMWTMTWGNSGTFYVDTDGELKQTSNRRTALSVQPALYLNPDVYVSSDNKVITENDEPPLVPDAALRKAINKLIGQPEDHNPTKSELQSLDSTVTIEFNYMGIKSIEGLQYTRAKYLYLIGNDISDPSPLNDLTTLAALNLGENHISDLSGIKDLLNRQPNLGYAPNQTVTLPIQEVLSSATSFTIENPITDADSSLVKVTPSEDYTYNDPNITWTGLTGSEESLSYTFDNGSGFTGTVTVPLEQVELLVPDDGLREAINSKLGQPGDHNPSMADLQDMTGELDARNREIKNLEGLQYATKLTKVVLSMNQIEDISQLSALTNLETLLLYDNHITDITPLGHLTKLTELGIYNNQITDIQSLGGLAAMKNLMISNNQITDISALGELTNLTSLSISNNEITDVSPLSGLTDLYNLNLSNNQIMDISDLGGLTRLDYLYASNNHISDLSPIKEVLDGLRYTKDFADQTVTLPTQELLSSVTSFTIENTITDADGSLVDVDSSTDYTYTAPNFTWIGLTGSEKSVSYTFNNGTNFTGTITVPLNWVTPLVPDDALRSAIKTELSIPANKRITKSDLESLASLTAESKGIQSLEGLQYATNLTKLNLYDNQISDASPLKGLTDLTDLTLAKNLIHDVSDLSGLTSLTHLTLFNNEIDDISPLGGLTSLTFLELHYNKITDLSPLEGLVNLEYLNLGYNKLAVLTSLSKLTELGYLSLSGNQITDVDPLAGLTNLNNLLLDDNDITNISPLEGLQNLFYFNASQNAISSLPSWVRSILIQNFNDQTVTLSGLDILTTADTLTFANKITDADGSVVNASPSADYSYTAPNVKWTGLTGSEKNVTYTFDNGTNFTGIVTLPLKWVQDELPVIDASDRTFTIGEDFDPLVGVTATDKESGDLTAAIQVTKNNVNPRKLGDYQVTYKVVDNGGQTTAKTITVSVVKPKNTIIIIPDLVTKVYAGQQGTIQGTNVMITMPSDLPLGTTLTVTDVSGSDEVTGAEGLKGVGKVFRFDFTYPGGLKSTEDFTLNFPYDLDTYSADQVDIYWYNEKAGKWEKQNGTVDADAGIITIRPTHFSTYGAFTEVSDTGNDDGDGSNGDNGGGTDDGTNSDNGESKDDGTKGSIGDNTDDGMNRNKDNSTKPGTNVNESNQNSSGEGSLPETSTGLYNWLLVGLVLLISGLVTILFRKRNRPHA